MNLIMLPSGREKIQETLWPHSLKPKWQLEFHHGGLRVSEKYFCSNTILFFHRIVRSLMDFCRIIYDITETSNSINIFQYNISKIYHQILNFHIQIYKRNERKNPISFRSLWVIHKIQLEMKIEHDDMDVWE